MKAVLSQFFWPPVTDGNYLNTARKRCLIVMSLVGAAVGLASGLRSFEDSLTAFPMQTIVGIAAPLILLVCPVILAFTNNLRGVAYFFLGFIFVSMVYIPLTSGGMGSRGALFMLPWAVMATLFLGWREGIVASILALTAFAVFHNFAPTAALTEIGSSAESLSSWLFVGLTMNLLVLTGAAAIFQREMERAAEKLTEARAEAQIANRAKSEFLANISHEIRTPMNGVLGMAEMLEATELSDTQQVYTKTILSSGHSLLAVINDILDLSQIEAGDEKLTSKPFNWRSAAMDLCADIDRKARQRGIDFKTELDGSLPDIVRGDETAFRQILIYLMDNALKFTDEGSIQLSAQGEVKGETLALEIKVADTGIGIPEDRIEHVFDKFAQVESSTTRRFDGAGAGLAISRLLARAMGGDVTARSQEGEGSTFCLHVKFPFVSDQSEVSNDTAPNANAPTPTRPLKRGVQTGSEKQLSSHTRVLVAEDNEVNRLVLKHLLSGQRYDVTFAVDGREAFEAFKSHDFDVILMDISMPNMDGYEATKAIRAHETLHNLIHTPIICVTAHTLDEHREKSLESGMNDYIPKPVAKESLRAKLKTWTGAAA